MENKLSVIVPFYNVEDNVDIIMECLINQTYKKLKIICIDDCSSDNTFEKLKKYEDYENVQIIRNKDNMGVSYTRNYGVKISESEYIGFIDSDDKIDLDYYEILMKKCESTNADVIVTDILSISENGKEEYYSKCCEGEVTKYNIINNGVAASACNKVIRKKMLEKYPFPNGKINEDVASIIPIIVNADKVEYTSETKYYYIQRRNSIQHKRLSTKRLDIFDAVDECFKLIENSNEFEKYKDAILYHQIIMFYFFVLPNEYNELNRLKLLRIFMKRQKKYSLYKNSHYEMFLEKASTLDKSYYSKLINCLVQANYVQANYVMANYDRSLDYENKITLFRYSKYFVRRMFLICKGIFRRIKKVYNNFINICKKIFIYKNVIKKNMTLKCLINLAKRQSKMKENKLKISVVIPNYNYEKFLYQRLYSILSQDKKIYEIILLDDKSKDNSREVLDEIYNEISKYIRVKKIYNEENSGSAFKQWKKGMEIAEGDYVWIAEADDYCSKKLLSNLEKPIFKDRNIYISYSDTAFIDGNGKIFLETIRNNIDLRNTKHWNKNFVNDGKKELEEYAFLNCTIANVSSCIIKKDEYEELFAKSCKYKQAGDWLFYVQVMLKGKVSYCKKVLNYYRVHGENITSKFKKEKHLEEIKSIHKEISELIKFTSWHEKEIQNRYEFLKEAWELDKD